MINFLVLLFGIVIGFIIGAFAVLVYSYMRMEAIRKKKEEEKKND